MNGNLQTTKTKFSADDVALDLCEEIEDMLQSIISAVGTLIGDKNISRALPQQLQSAMRTCCGVRLACCVDQGASGCHFLH